jgi:hypothetical protein
MQVMTVPLIFLEGGKWLFIADRVYPLPMVAPWWTGDPLLIVSVAMAARRVLPPNHGTILQQPAEYHLRIIRLHGGSQDAIPHVQDGQTMNNDARIDGPWH